MRTGWLSSKLTSGIGQIKRIHQRLVLRAGTGRIATSLAVSGNGLVVALDHNLARLRRIASSSRLARVCGDMRQLPLSQEFDEIVIPYSTFQLLPRDTGRRRAVQLAARLLACNGMLHIDVSASFDERLPNAWHVVLTGNCDELVPRQATFARLTMRRSRSS